MSEIKPEYMHRYLPELKGGHYEAGHKRDDGTWEPFKQATYCQSLEDCNNVTNRWPKVTCPGCLAHAPPHLRIGCKCCETVRQ